MQASKRRVDPGVARRLLMAPYRFQFFQAMRIIEQALAHRKQRATTDVVAAHVRFQSSLSMGYPSAEIQDMQAWSDQGDLLDRDEAVEHALITESIQRIRITPAFMGMLGPYGAMPLHYSEQIAQREVYHRDRAARAFMDLFTTRAVALHYAAWKKYRPALGYELDRKNQFLPLLLALSGMGMPGMRERLLDGRGDVFDHALAYYAGHLRQRPVCADVIQRLLSGYFGVQIRIEQFVGAWYAVPSSQASRLGSDTAVLGVNALAGQRVWQRDLRMRLLIGPLSRERYEAFMPGHDAAEALAKWLQLLSGKQLEYEVRLILRAEDVQGFSLGSGGGQLGRDSYLSTRPETSDRSDCLYTIHGTPRPAAGLH